MTAHGSLVKQNSPLYCLPAYGTLGHPVSAHLTCPVSTQEYHVLQPEHTQRLSAYISLQYSTAYLTFQKSTMHRNKSERKKSAVNLVFPLEIGGSTKILGKIVSYVTAVLRKLTRLLTAHIQKRKHHLAQKPPHL